MSEIEIPKNLFELALVCAGNSHAVFLTTDGNVFATGRNVEGQLGTGDLKNEFQPRRVMFPNDERVIKIWSNKGRHNFFLTESGKLYGCGFNEYGSLGLKERKNYPEPVFLEFFRDRRIVNVFCCYHSYVVTKDEIFCMGYNKFGNLGVGNREHQVEPRRFEFIFEHKKNKILSIGCGVDHTLFLISNRSVWSTGRNDEGQLGIGDKTDRIRPTKIQYLTNEGIRIVQVAAGWKHSIYLAKNHLVYVSGRNKDGELGLGDTVERLIPTVIRALSHQKIVKVGAGYYFSCFISKGNDLFLCGDNSNGELGVVEPKKITVPIMIQTNLRFIDSAGGEQFSVYLTKDGYLYSTGNNTFGQLGLEDEKRKSKKRLSLIESLRLYNRKVFVYSQKKLIQRFYMIIKNNSIKDSFIKFHNTDFGMFKFLAYDTELFLDLQGSDIHEVNCSVDFNEEQFFKMLFGIDEKEFSQKDLLTCLKLYDICSKLKLRKYEYLILKKLQEIRDLEALIRLFTYSFKKYEKKKNEIDMLDVENILQENFRSRNLQFHSVFNLNLFNMFKARYSEIAREKKYFRVFEYFRISRDLRDFEIQPIEIFYKLHIPKEDSFAELYLERLQTLYENRNKHFNMSIISRDKKEVRVHREIIMFESDYFYQVLLKKNIKPGGFLMFDRMTYTQLKLILSYVYTKRMSLSESMFAEAFEMLVEVHPYYEKEFEQLLVKKLLKMSVKMIKKNIFVEHFRKFAHLFHLAKVDFPDEYKIIFFTAWSKLMDKEALMKIIDKSYFRNKLLEENERTHRRFADENKKLHERVEKKERDNRKLIEKVLVLERDNEKLTVEAEYLKKKNDGLERKVRKLENELEEKFKKMIAESIGGYIEK